MKILILYIHITGYLESCLKALATNFNAEVTVIHHSQSQLSPFKVESHPQISYFPKSEDLLKKTEAEIQNFRFVLCAGWLDSDYLKLARMARSADIPVVVGFDNQWIGNSRQIAATVLRRSWIKQHFSAAFVSGERQFVFAQRLGFTYSRISTGYYSADVPLFEKGRIETKHQKNKENKRLVFIGRLVEEKGVLPLFRAFTSIVENNSWELHFIGEGPLQANLAAPNVFIRPFLQPQELAKELPIFDAFILPSSYEPWGVVVHEAVTAGLPVLASFECGSADWFVIHQYNGLRFFSNENEIQSTLRLLFSFEDDILSKMSERSIKLSNKHNPELWAYKLMQLVY